MRAVIPGRSWRAWSGVCRALLVLVVGSGALTACGPSTDPSPDRPPAVTSGMFIDVVTALREAEREVAEEDSAAALFEERKAEILARHGVTQDELHAFILRNGRDTELLRQVWDSINNRLKRARPSPADVPVPGGRAGRMPQ